MTGIIVVLLTCLFMLPHLRPQVKAHDDQYFYVLASTTQAYFQEQAIVLGLDPTRQPSKECANQSVGGPSPIFGKGTFLKCQIDLGGKIASDKIDAANSIVSLLVPILIKQGFTIRDEEQINMPRSRTTVLLWATIEGDTIGNLCTAELIKIENSDGYGRKSLSYNLSCGDVARDTPQGFTNLL